ncbi:MAG: hypothetical protein IJ068_05010 [Bacilli bacterium]|nr:hypothetical protein [Bacilli bacterium]
MNKFITKEEFKKNPNYIVPICYDEVYKEIFGNPQNIVFTEYLVSALLNIPYKVIKGKIHFQTKNSLKLNVKKRNIEKDVVFLVEVKEPQILNLEMNLHDLTNLKIKRNTKYISDIYSNLQVPSKDKNIKVKYVTQFNFNTECVDKENKLIYDEYYYRNDKGHILTNTTRIVHINVAKMSELWYNNEYKKYPDISSIVFWFGAVIMTHEKKKLKELVNNAPIDKQIATMLERKVLNMNDDSELFGRYYNREEEYKFWRDLEREELKEEAIEEGHQEGLKEGILQYKTQIVMTMHEKNYPLETIKEITKLSEKEINKIIKNNSKSHKK